MRPAPSVPTVPGFASRLLLGEQRFLLHGVLEAFEGFVSGDGTAMICIYAVI
jgi:hypothetical protein